MPSRMNVGLLTQRQVQVLSMRKKGLSQAEVAKQLRTSRENVTMLEKRAWQNIDKARATLVALQTYGLSVRVPIRPGTHLVDIPRVMIDRADKAHVALRANFTRIYEDIRFKAKRSIKGARVMEPLTIWIMPDGDFTVEEKRD